MLLGNIYKKPRSIFIREGEDLHLKKRYAIILQRYIDKNPNLSKIINLNKKDLSFSNYIVGEISIDDLNICIQPRITGLTTNNYYEMKLYVNGINNNHIKAFLGNTYKDNIIDNILTLFLNVMSKLVKNGLEGSFITKSRLSKFIHGKILVNKITPLNLRLGRLPISYNSYNLSTPENKILKLALYKCRFLIRNSKNLDKYNLIRAYFDDIHVFPSEYKYILFRTRTHQENYMNNEYPIALRLAERILEGLNINMEHQRYLCSSFLMNSNDLFEKYSRRILQNNLNYSVKKWRSEKTFGQYVINGQLFKKSYVPDVLVDYRQDTNSARIVLDAKDKDVSDPHNLAKIPDIYEVLFYCKHLHTNKVGLLYPLYGRRRPVQLNLYKSNIKFYMFFIDFKLPIDRRNDLFVQDVNKIFIN